MSARRRVDLTTRPELITEAHLLPTQPRTGSRENQWPLSWKRKWRAAWRHGGLASNGACLGGGKAVSVLAFPTSQRTGSPKITLCGLGAEMALFQALCDKPKTMESMRRLPLADSLKAETALPLFNAYGRDGLLTFLELKLTWGFSHKPEMPTGQDISFIFSFV